MDFTKTDEKLIQLIKKNLSEGRIEQYNKVFNEIHYYNMYK